VEAGVGAVAAIAVAVARRRGAAAQRCLHAAAAIIECLRSAAARRSVASICGIGIGPADWARRAPMEQDEEENDEDRARGEAMPLRVVFSPPRERPRA
jgi:hypothetical protein